MKRIFSLTLALLLSFGAFAQQPTADFFNQVDALLKKYVKNGQVDYAGLKGNADLNKLIQFIEGASVDGIDTKTKQAFYINAYNLTVIKAAADAYPLGSVLDINGFFDTGKFRELAIASRCYKIQGADTLSNIIYRCRKLGVMFFE